MLIIYVRTNMKKIIVLLLFIFPLRLFSQSLDEYKRKITNNKPLTVSGQISANSVYYNSNQNTNRSPFTYFLQGRLNVSVYGFSMPISYSFSNQGSNYKLPTLFDFNKVSLHPKYKWVTAHIGTVSMKFSPYTLNGHRFKGVGVDASPFRGFKVSVMAGELRKAINPTENPKVVPSFRRMGYGLKTYLKKRKYGIGIIGFYAKDDINSIKNLSEVDKRISPKENFVIGLEGEAAIATNYKLQAEFATTAITKDIRSGKLEGTRHFPLFFTNRTSTEYHKALKTRLGYHIRAFQLGVGYERIDPGYQTLGMHYFNNDLENITLDVANVFFNSRLSLALNIGYQKDNLNSSKSTTMGRSVGALNVQLTLSPKINISGSFSNFSTYTNTRLNQFDVLNETNLLNNQIEEFEYRQLSRNLTCTVNYTLSNRKDKSQNIVLNYSLNDAVNEQNKKVRVGDASSFHNMGLIHTIKKNTLLVTTGLNATYNTIGRKESYTWGPTLGLRKPFFDKKLLSSVTCSYNSSTDESKSGNTQITNIRMGLRYTALKKHNFSLIATQLLRSVPKKNMLTEFTTTLGYNYSFNLKKPKIKLPKFTKKLRTFHFNFRGHTFEGLHSKISNEILQIITTEEFKNVRDIDKIINDLSLLATHMRTNENEKNSMYKKGAIAYLKYLYKHKDFIDIYHKLAFKSLKKLYADASKLDLSLNKEYEESIAAKENPELTAVEMKKIVAIEQKYKAHRWMEQELKRVTWSDVVGNSGVLDEFKKKYISKVFDLLDKGAKNEDVLVYLEVRFADFYHKKSYLLGNDKE